MGLARTDKNLLSLLVVNAVLFSLHIHENCTDMFYFFQLTIIGQVVVIVNFLLSITLHEKKSGSHIRLLLSRLHLVSLGLEAVVVAGFWVLRVFFKRGILKEGD